LLKFGREGGEGERGFGREGGGGGERVGGVWVVWGLVGFGCVGCFLFFWLGVEGMVFWCFCRWCPLSLILIINWGFLFLFLYGVGF